MMKRKERVSPFDYGKPVNHGIEDVTKKFNSSIVLHCPAFPSSFSP